MFRTFANLTVGSAATLLLAAGTPSLVGSANTRTTAPIHLICQGASEAPMCKALNDVLKRAAKGRDIRLLSEDAPASDPHHMTIRFVKNAQSEDSLSGYLLWQAAGEAPETGPTLEISVMDAVLTEKILNSFAEQLLKSSNIPM
jgi:hypothetical protein